MGADLSTIYLQKTFHLSFQRLQLFARAEEKTVETIQTQQQKAKRAKFNSDNAWQREKKTIHTLMFLI